MLHAGIEVPKGAEAHHIIPSNVSGKYARLLRNKIKKLGIDINDGHNCVILPSDEYISNEVGTAIHSGYVKELHDIRPMKAIWSKIKDCASKEEAYNVLDGFAKDMYTNNLWWL